MDLVSLSWVHEETRVMRTVLKSDEVSKTPTHLLVGQVSGRSSAHRVGTGDWWQGTPKTGVHLKPSSVNSLWPLSLEPDAFWRKVRNV